MRVETVQLLDAFEHLKGSEKDSVYMSVSWCLSESFDQDDLSKEDVATIKAYTNGWVIYSPLNAALNSEKLEEIKPWFHYLKLLDMAVSKLPRKPGIYCRGVNANISHLYTVGSIVTWVCYR